MALPQVSSRTWSALNRLLYESFNKTQASDLGPIGTFVMNFIFSDILLKKTP